MRIVAVVGLSETGKTRLVVRLIEEFRRRGLRVAAVKRCSHGFSLDTEGKDSADFNRAGADGVALVSPEGWAAFGAAPDVSPSGLAARLFPRSDVVLIEGGKDVRGVPKIEVLRAGVSDVPVSRPEELVALIADIPAPRGFSVPVHGTEDIGGIADRILSFEEGN
jgi:molybdopterin-guanine dinucleotide biosynthesis protein MobB